MSIPEALKKKHDIFVIVDHILKNDSNKKVGIWGNSLGGAISIQALELDERITFGIIESTFKDLRQIVYDYQKRYCFNIGFKWLCNRTLDNASSVGNFDPDKVRPMDSVVNIEQPVFLAHGDADANIRFEYGQHLYEHLASEDKIFYRVKGGGHYNLFKVGGESYTTALFDFIQDQTDIK